MIAALAWKDYREQRALWLAMAGLTALMTLGLTRMLDLAGIVMTEPNKSAILITEAVIMVAAYGLICGASLLAGEEESRTLSFLDTLTGRRAALWGVKLLVGLVLVVGQALLIAAMMTYLDVQAATSSLASWQHALLWIVMLAALALDGLVFGMMISAICKNVLSAAGLAVSIYPFTWAAGFLAVLMYSSLTQPWHLPDVQLAMFFGFHGIVAVIALWASWRLFCGADIQRRRGAAIAGVGTVSRRIEAASGWRSLAWLSFKQGWPAAVVLGVLGVAAVITFLGIGAHVGIWLLGWPVLTLVVGVICGLGVFAGEQNWGAQRFLAEQRLPAGRIWAIKTIMWFGLAAGIACLVLLGTAPFCGWAGVLDTLRQSEEGLIIYTRIDAVVGAIFVVQWLVYGFSIGQFCVLVVRKPVVAGVIAILLCPIAAIWWPSLVGGGLTLWQVLALPVLLLAATRFLLWSWAGGGLYQGKSALALFAWTILAVVALPFGVWYRVLQIPDVGEPFDVSAYIASLPTPEQNKAGLACRTAFLQLEQRWQEAEQQFPSSKIAKQTAPIPKPFAFASGTASRQLQHVLLELGVMADSRSGPLATPVAITVLRRVNVAPSTMIVGAIGASPYRERDPLARVLEEGWAMGDSQLGRQLDFVFEGSWIKRLREITALPVGMLEDPRTLNYFNIPIPHQLWLAIRVLRARALQLQANGHDGQALDQLVLALAVCRSAQHHGASRFGVIGQSEEWKTVASLQHWLANCAPKPALLRRALDEVERHEAERAPFSEHLRADYLLIQNMLESPESWLSHGTLSMALHVPWEKERQRRLLNAVFAGLFRAAAVNYRQWLALYEQSSPGGTPGYGQLRQLGWEQANKGLNARRLGSLLTNSWVSLLLPHQNYRLPAALMQCRLRGLQLQLALAIYQIETGKPAAALDELVPRVIRSLPADPFTDQSFHYRVSKGEQISRRVYVQTNNDALDVAPGQGVVWSPGPDVVDNGGKIDADTYGWDSPLSWLGMDLVFIVPYWPR